jgi:acyl-CoA dehydrogenase
MSLDFSFSEEHEMVRQSARDVMKQFEGRRDELREMIVEKKKFPQDVWDAVAEAGFLGSIIPEEYGGTNMGLLPYTIAVEEFAALGFGNALMVVTIMDAACILKNGTEEMKKRILPGICDGSLKLAFAVTEPNAGSNTFRLQTTAIREGDHFRMNGQKTFITGADVCDYVMVVARSLTLEQAKEQGLPKSYGLSIFLVPTGIDGYTMTPLPMKGIEGFRQFQLDFNDVMIPDDMLIGDEHGGTMALFNSLNPERILAGAISCGMTRYLLERSCDYARDRRVFKDTPIGAYQAIQHPLAEIRIHLDAVQLLTYRAAWAFDEGLPPGQVGMYANMAKYMGAEMGIDAADRAIQTHGGNGFSTEYGVVHYWEAARLLRTAPISKEMILNYVAEHVLQLPRSY